MGGAKETGVYISNFINSKKRVLDMFDIGEDFFVKPLLDKHWEISAAEDDFYVLRHGEREGAMQSLVVVKKDNIPIIKRKNKYTMVVALDCVKVCFILDNSKHIGKMPEF